MNNYLIEAALNLLDQLKDSIKQTSDSDFSKPSKVLNGASIGQHVRHTLEFFLCLLDASGNAELDYDNRKHDKFIEQDKKLALSVLDDLSQFVSGQKDNFPINLTVNYDLEKELKSTIASNYFRELAYNIEHAIHHMALIKIGINEVCPYVRIDKSYGVASSTIRYQNKVD